MLTQSKLKKVLHYDPHTGIFMWIICRSGVRKNRVAGCPDPSGYIQIRINGQKYYGHRLAWLYMTGKWPTEIDHRDLNPSNNRWDNLRLATRPQNSANKLKYSTNTSGFKGVRWREAKHKNWIAQIKVRGKYYFLGSFLSPAEAHEAYRSAAERLCGEFARK